MEEYKAAVRPKNPSVEPKIEPDNKVLVEKLQPDLAKRPASNCSKADSIVDMHAVRENNLAAQ